METLRITEAELARDVRAVLAKVEHGSGVIIEREDHRPAAVISAPHRSGRPIAEILAEARQRNSTVTLDEGFGKDLEEIIDSHQQPCDAVAPLAKMMAEMAREIRRKSAGLFRA